MSEETPSAISKDDIKLNAAADAPDLRDRMYEPALVQLQSSLMPDRDHIKIGNQLKEGACTGFSLAAAIDILNSKRGRSSVKVSPKMLYEMAKRFDEWTGEDYEGSSLRGAIRGWSHNGVCPEESWPYQTTDSPEDLTLERARAARSNALGAYYRLRPNISDYHAALNETGVICASARVHGGWFDPLDSEGRIVNGDRIPTAGHAFAIIGYNSAGFYIQNSWGTGWGDKGIAIWPYEDWAENVMDAWVFRLALPIPTAFSLKVGSAGNDPSRESDQFGWFWSGPKRSEIAGHFVHIDDGKFHDKGRYDSNENDVRVTAQQLADSSRGYKHLVFYAHGGLNSPKSSAKRVRGMKQVFKDNKIYPFHFMYDTGLLEELQDVILGKSDRAGRRAGSFFDGSDRIVENRVRRIGTLLWDETKEGAEKAFQSTGAGFSTLDIFANALSNKDIKIHLIGHSAGAIFLADLMAATDNVGSWTRPIETCSLLAPACTVDLYHSHYHKRLGANPAGGATPLNRLNVYSLTDELEQDDTVTPLYRKSLLYLISNAFEGTPPLVSVPLLGMRKFENKVTKDANLEVIYSGVGSPPRSRSRSHGGFDNDVDTMNDILSNILGGVPADRWFTHEDLKY